MSEDATDGAGALPGEPISPWLATTPETEYEPLEESVRVEVAVVGGGIAGLSTAYELRERGIPVAVLERDRIAAAVTGKTTAKLTSQHGLCYDHLRREFGPRAARRYADVNRAAIETVADRVGRWNGGGVDGDAIDGGDDSDDEVDSERDDLGSTSALEDRSRNRFGFERRPHYVYGNDRDAVEREADAARAAGCPASFVTSVPPFDRAECAVRFDDQACFHPRRYLLRLAEELTARSGAEIFERTRVTELEPGSPCRLETPGGSVTAERVVVATGFPILDRAGYFARLYPKRSYVLGMRLEDERRYPEGMYYDAGDPYRSVRTHRDEDGTLLLVGGENHKTGQGGSTVERYRTLARWARERFPVRSIDYRWSTQDYVSADRVPFVGRLGPGARNVFVATGFGGWGMTTGVAAGRLLAAALDDEEPPALELFDPGRFAPKAGFGAAVTENADAASQFATDWARTLLAPDRESIDRGEGRVVRRGGRPVALSRDEDGDLHAVSAVCTHMRCLVDWNDAEGSWDCPCHGSRFSADGEVLEGPATEDLPRRDVGDR